MSNASVSSSSTTINSNPEDKFFKRKGTTDLGKDYEDYIPAYFTLKFLQNEKIKNFKVWCNDGRDDVITDVEFVDGSKEKVAIQLKHKVNFDITVGELGARSVFNILKYFDSFQKHQQILSDHKLILWTNAKFLIHVNSVLKLENSEPRGPKFWFKDVVDVKIVRSDKPVPLLETLRRGDCYKFIVIIPHWLHEGRKRELQKYKYFFEKFFLYTSQPNVDDLKNELIPKTLGTFTSEHSAIEEYLKFISNWNKDEGWKYKLSRTNAIKILTLCLLEKHFYSYISSGVSAKTEYFQTAVSSFDITVCHPKALDGIRKLWGNFRNLIGHYDIDRIEDLRKLYHIHTQEIKNINVLTQEQCTKMLWLMDQCPLIVEDHPTTHEAIKLCGNIGKFIIVTKEILPTSLIRRLSDLERYEAVYNNILKNYELTLLGEKISLEELIKEDESFKDLITTKEIVAWIEDSNVVKLEEEQLPVPYIDRYLYRSVIDFKYLKHIDEKTLVLISNVHNEKEFVNFRDFEIININKDTDDEMIMGNTLKRRKLYISETETPKEIFKNLCEQNQNFKKCHHFRLHHGCLEWVESIGGVSDLHRYCTKNEECIQSEINCANNIRNKINIVTGDSGMGKTLFMKKLNNNLLSKYLTIIISPNNVDKLRHSIKETNFEEFFNLILDSKWPNFENFDRRMLKLLIKKRKLIILWDALDELSEDDRFIIDKFILLLTDKIEAQFICSRRYLKNSIENKFGVMSEELVPFDIEQQTLYIYKRLEDVSLIEKLNTITEAIKSNISLTSNSDILGIPLHIFMTTELFRHNLEKYTKQFIESSTFSIIDLYDHFVDEKFQFHFNQKWGGDYYGRDKILKQMKKRYIENYQKVALRMLFGEDFFNFDCEDFLKEVSEEGDGFGFLTEVRNNSQVEFVHVSFAEYFAARYLFGHQRSFQKLRDVIFDRKYTNVRFFFDIFASKDSPAHLAVLSDDLEFFEKCGDELKDKDLLGRSVLHLAASWGERYPILNVYELTDDSAKTLEEATLLLRLKEVNGIFPERSYFIDDQNGYDVWINEKYQKILEKLLEKCDPEEKDEMFGFTPIVYAEKCECLFAAAFIAKKQNSYLKSKDENFVCSLLYHAVVRGYEDIIDMFDNVQFLYDSQGYSLLHIAVENNRNRYVEKLLSQETYRKNIDFKNTDGMTAFYIASDRGFLDIIKSLKEHNAMVDAAARDGAQPLHAAAFYGHKETVNFLAQLSSDINVRNDSGWTPLQLAVQNGHLEVVKCLRQQNAEINTMANSGPTLGSTSLHTATVNGHLEIVKYLVEQGASIDANVIGGWTPLHFAALNGHIEIVKYLKEQNANIDLSNNNGVTPLYLAASNGHLEIVEYLAQHNANINATNNKKGTPLHAAVDDGNLEIIKYLISKGASISATTYEGWTPLHIAAKNGQIETVKYLTELVTNVNVVNNDGRTPLHMAALNGHLETVQFLLQKNANINSSSDDGWTPLHAAAENGHLEIVKHLIRENVNVNVATSEGWTPLHDAAEKGYFKTVTYLKQHGAKIDATSDEGWTPLHVAAENGHLEIVKYLAQHDAKFNTTVKDGWTPLHAAAENGHIETVKYLIDKIDINSATDDGNTPLYTAVLEGHLHVVKFLLEAGATMEIPEEHNTTPLIEACTYGHYEIVKLLIDYGANMNAVDDNNLTAIGSAFFNKHDGIVQLLMENGVDEATIGRSTAPLYVHSKLGFENSVEQFIKMGADFDRIEADGWRPIHAASAAGHAEIVGILLEAGADYKTPTAGGESAVDLAIQNGHEDLAQFIQTFNGKQL